MCRDYVTEKVIHPLEYESVPIVYGDGNYHIFPPNSYIHAYDYYSPARLAEYLHFLDGNDTAYNLHMEWRYNRTLVQSHGPFAAKKNGFCRLCQKLHSPVLSMVSKSYASIESWWSLGDDWRRGPSFNNRVRIKPFLNRESVCRHPYWLFDPMHLNEKDTYKGIKTNWSVQ
ncbi:hypothetical protein BV898_00663 [Hypsibius exemplaris]|uniref:Fucosyltransferase n=1 Tax=Hypsibius exemplaris TaxID=2072580 RepID=A0A1W0XE36_HYPEX|nr:hypothetical protein BV898_00663 [Hypsibius exemplaris]